MSDEQKPRKKRGGRVAGVPNKRTLIGKSVSETLSNWLGFDDAAVERTGMIDGKGYGGRLKLEAMWNKGRPIDPQFVALGKFLFSYAYGNPGKMVMESKQQRPPVIFLGSKPWDPENPNNKAMDARSARMIEAKDAEEKLRALEAKQPEIIDVESAKADEGETLERVIEPPPPDPSAFR